MNINRFKFNNNLIVMGNQAADLDSTVSAVSMATLLSQINPSLQIRPLVQGHPDDLKLKPEIVALFRRAGIPLDDSLFSETAGKNLDDPLILVDHNEPDNSQIHHSIAGIVDHHDDRGLYPDLPLREVKRTGSCTTLISSFWKEYGLSIP
jgi:exopolyphosphatase